MRLFNFSAENCKNCHKCVRNCPVKAIRFKKNRAEIDEDKCIACGQCFVVCPKHARNVENDVDLVMHALKSHKKLYALIDSSYLGLFDSPARFISGLKKLGFYSVQEIAAASEVIAKEYISYINEHKDNKYVISACCPTTYLYIQKYHPALSQFLLPVVTPMVALGKLVKKEDPEGYTVYIGPCLSKKYETGAQGENAAVNAYITFEEIMRMFRRKFIKLEELPGVAPDRVATAYGKKYSITGDILPDLKDEIEENAYDYMAIDGLSDVTNLFSSMEQGMIDRAYVSISACRGSCINGPFTPMHSENIFARKQKIKHFAEHGWETETKPVDWSGINLRVSHTAHPVARKRAAEEEIKAILADMDKHTAADEFNCGACGYDTCRKKAQAVFEGMAEVEMCMPYMRAKAENMSDVIFLNAQNIIMILDEELMVKQFNPVAEKSFQMKAENIIGKPISKLMDDKDFFDIRFSQERVIDKKVHLANYGMIVMENIMYLKKEKEIIVTMRDVTEDEKHKEELDKLKIRTVDIAQNVIEKQMRVAQEIASLLGETTAETKVALNRLKDVVLKEGD